MPSNLINPRSRRAVFVLMCSYCSLGDGSGNARVQLSFVRAELWSKFFSNKMLTGQKVTRDERPPSSHSNTVLSLNPFQPQSDSSSLSLYQFTLRYKWLQHLYEQKQHQLHSDCTNTQDTSFTSSNWKLILFSTEAKHTEDWEFYADAPAPFSKASPRAL